jgi:dehydrogenase/reductase SDR family member 7B
LNTYFTGKKIWITGASSGIGEQLAIQLSASASVVILSARKLVDLERVKSLCRGPAAIEIVLLDLQDENAVRQAAAEVFSRHDYVDILFNNGGISQRAEAMQTPLLLVRRIFEVNFFSNILLSQLVAEKMLRRRSGHIVVTSSLLGKWGFHERSSYAATKHALHGYYESMRMEVEKKGIHITLVTPGFIATDISKHALDESGNPTNQMDNNQAGGITAAECAARILQGVAARRMEFGVGGRELAGLKMKRFLPKLFDGILRKRSAR